MWDYNRITGIINAQRSVTADTALRLGHWFGTSPDFWLNLQMLYELRLAQREIGKRVEKLPRRANRKRKDNGSISPPLPLAASLNLGSFAKLGIFCIRRALPLRPIFQRRERNPVQSSEAVLRHV
jgi:hypothetical protein